MTPPRPEDLPPEDSAEPHDRAAPVASRSPPSTDEATGSGHASTASSALGSTPHAAPVLPLPAWGELLSHDAGQEPAARDQQAAPAIRKERYLRLNLLGEGSFGAVYRAHDTQLDRIVALKAPRAGTLEQPDAVDRFLREARHAARLDHPGIVRIYDSGVVAGRPFIVSEFVAAPTLKELAPQLPWAPARAAELVERLARAVHHAHDQGVIHRDLKPSNILIDSTGAPRILDFGLAKQLDATATLTADGAVMGTPAYMSPEQAAGRSHDAGPGSDIYSLGVILFELLTGERPFSGHGSALLRKVIEDEPPALRTLNARAPLDLEVIVARCLEKHREQRYATAVDLADDLRRYRTGEPIVARPIGHVERALRWGARHPYLVWPTVAILAVLTIALTLVTRAWRGERAARVAADESRAAALDYLERARAATDASLLGADLALRGLPRAALARRHFLSQAAHNYERFLAHAPSDPALRVELAHARLKLGDLWLELGDLDRAAAEYERIAALTSAAPLDDSLSLAQAAAAVKRGIVDLRRQAWASAAQRLDAAIAQLDQLPADPASPATKSRRRAILLAALINNAAALDELGRDADSHRLAQRLLELVDLEVRPDQAAPPPDVDLDYPPLVAALLHVHDRFLDAHQLDDAETAATRAAAVLDNWQALVGDEHHEWREWRVAWRERRALLEYSRAGRESLAEAWREAFDDAAWLRAADPGSLSHVDQLLRIAAGLAFAHRRLDEPDRAIALSSDAWQLVAELAQNDSAGLRVAPATQALLLTQWGLALRDQRAWNESLARLAAAQRLHPFRDGTESTPRESQLQALGVETQLAQTLLEAGQPIVALFAWEVAQEHAAALSRQAPRWAPLPPLLALIQARRAITLRTLGRETEGAAEFAAATQAMLRLAPAALPIERELFAELIGPLDERAEP